MTSVSLNGVNKKYGSVKALLDVDLEVEQGEFLTLLGPSGCGKTTLLRVIAGLLEPSDGNVVFGNRVMNSVPPHKRNVGLVFQNYALFPHMTVSKNVGFGLKMRCIDNKIIDAEVQKILEMVQLPDQGDRYPSQLSGGQQQRVGLARALVIKPAILLLDEPFGALDKKLREAMQLELRQLQQALKVTSIFVTHDQDEALTISDRVAVMNNGRIEQIDTPRTLYEEPATPFVLQFVGVSNCFQGKVTNVGTTGLVVQTTNGYTMSSSSIPEKIHVGENVLVACRPEKVWISSGEESGAHENCIPAVVTDVVYLGSLTHYYLESLGGDKLVVYQLNQAGDGGTTFYKAKDRVNVKCNAADILVFKQ